MAQAQFTRAAQETEYVELRHGMLAVTSTAEKYSTERLFYRSTTHNWVVATGLPTITGASSLGVILERACGGYHAFVALAKELGGGYAMAHWDEREQKLAVVTDPLGLQPIYLYHGDGVFLLSTDLRGIAASRHVALDLDPAGWGAFFGIGHFLGGRTSLSAVQRLTGATELVFDPISWSVQRSRYWSLPAAAPVHSLDQVNTGDIVDVVRQEVRAYARHNPKAGILLSGGFDSRMILNLVVEEELDTTAIVVSHRDEHFDADGRFAKRVAKRLGVRTEFHKPQDFFSSKAFLEWLRVNDVSAPALELFIAQVATFVRPELGAVWEGLGPGHGLTAPHRAGVNMNDIRAYARTMTKGPSHPVWAAARAVFRKGLADEMFEGFSSDLERELDACGRDYFGVRRFSLSNRVPNRTALPPYKVYSNNVLPYTPGIGRDFWKLIFTLPLHVLEHQEVYKLIFRRHFPRVADIPFCSGGKLVRVDRRPDLEYGMVYGLSRIFRNPHLAGLVRRITPMRSADTGIDLVRSVIQTADPSHPDLNGDEVRSLQQNTGLLDAVSERAMLTLFYWKMWRSMMQNTQYLAENEPFIAESQIAGGHEDKSCI